MRWGLTSSFSFNNASIYPLKWRKKIMAWTLDTLPFHKFIILWVSWKKSIWSKKIPPFCKMSFILPLLFFEVIRLLCRFKHFKASIFVCLFVHDMCVSDHCDLSIDCNHPMNGGSPVVLEMVYVLWMEAVILTVIVFRWWYFQNVKEQNICCRLRTFFWSKNISYSQKYKSTWSNLYGIFQLKIKFPPFILGEKIGFQSQKSNLLLWYIYWNFMNEI